MLVSLGIPVRTGPFLGILLLWQWAQPPLARAHDSPEHVVTFLSEKMQQEGATAALLHQRAVEYRALGNLKAATVDLVRARKLQPDSLPVLQELCQVQQAEGKFAAALQTINETLALSNAVTATELWIIRAGIHLDLGDPAACLADCRQAFLQPEPPLDWYLVRSQAQAMLKLHRARVQDLQEGVERFGSSVLKLEWIDALLAAGDFSRALQESEAEMESSRWRSTWLLRHAQARLGLGELAAGRQDLRAVVAEIEQRLNPTRPDVTLLADRGIAWALLQQPEKAQQDLDSARKAGADDWVVKPLAQLLKNSTVAHAP